MKLDTLAKPTGRTSHSTLGALSTDVRRPDAGDRLESLIRLLLEYSPWHPWSPSPLLRRVVRECGVGGAQPSNEAVTRSSASEKLNGRGTWERDASEAFDFQVVMDTPLVDLDATTSPAAA